MPVYADGTLINAPGQPNVDLMQNGQRRWVQDPETFNCMGLDWGAIQHIAQVDWDATPPGLPFPSRKDGSLLIGSGPKVYVIQGCQRHWIPDPLTLQQFGGWSAVKSVHDIDLNAIREGPAIPSAQGTVTFDANWAGVQINLGHTVVTDIQATAKEGGAIYAFLLPLAIRAGMTGPWSIAVGLLASYIATELVLVGAMDHGNGVTFTAPWLALTFGQWWVLIPSSR